MNREFKYNARQRAGSILLWACAFVSVGHKAADAGEIDTIRAIVIPANATAQRIATAELLADYWFRSTGSKLEITATAPTGLAIHVGSSDYVKAQHLQLDTSAPDSFVAKRIDQRNFVIVGPTRFGTEFGVYDFLERCLGVRWLMPGEFGVDVPKHRSVDVPITEAVSAPAFRSRKLSGLRGAAQRKWARRLRMHGRIKFHHNMNRLFPPSRYADAHPEFYPMMGGRRYIPTSDKDQNWQPDFAAAGLTREAVRRINKFFGDNPKEQSYSLGINDSRRVPDTAAARKNYLGMPSLSELYYRWCNDVVAGVLQTHPDKIFGCLAYNTVAEPPANIKLHDRLVPFLTFERYQWLDPSKKAFGHALTRRWGESASALGWYDYLYGSPYCLPRFYPHVLQESLRFAREHGVTAYYAEAYPNLGEGPRLYILLKLLWDPDLDVDALLEEWCVRCVGPVAAPSLQAYYRIWQDFWTKTIPKTEWFAQGQQYLPFYLPTYLAEADGKLIARCQTLLERSVNESQTADQRKRALHLHDAFQYYRFSALAYGGLADVLERRIDTEDQALAALDRDVGRLVAADKRRDVVARFESHPLLSTPTGWDRYPALRGDNWCAGMMWSSLPWIEKSERLRRHVQSLTGHENAVVRRRAAVLLRLADGRMTGDVLDPNASFEKGLGGWKTWVKWNTGAIRIDSTEAYSGRSSVYCLGVKRGGPYQILDVRPGRYLAVVYAKQPAGQRRHGTVTITATMLDEKRANIDTPGTKVKPVPGRWIPICCEIEIPALKDGKPVRQVRLIPVVDGFAPGEGVYLDDVKLYRLP